MPVYNIFIVNRAGSLIYDTAHNSPNTSAACEKTFTFPLPFTLQVGHCITAVNGQPVKHNARLSVGDVEHNAIEYVSNKENYPLSMQFARPAPSTNEKIILSSMFHSLFAIAAQLSPVTPAQGIQRIDAEYFTLHCHQTLTGVKFIAVVDPSSTKVDTLLAKLYEHYADYALKNPFYSLDMPIRASLFETAVNASLERYNQRGSV